MSHIDCCSFCQKEKKKLESLKIALFFLIAIIFSYSVFSVSGNSSFTNLEPNCTINKTSFLNCSEQPIKLNCKIANFQFVNAVSFNFNNTIYQASQLANPNHRNWTNITTINQKNQTANFIYNWVSTTIYDTAGNIAIFPQNATLNHTCPDCFSQIININSSCGINDVKNVTYTDLSNCTSPIPANTTASCDFCSPNYQCSNYSTCGLSDSYKYCYAISDNNTCFAQTGLASDNFTGTLDDFTAPCTFNDFVQNTTLLSSFHANLQINQYPYVEVNTTITMAVSVTLEGVPIQISNVQMQLLNQTIVFNYNPSTQLYERSIVIHETGDYPFVITGRDNTTNVFTIGGMFLVREFVNLNVELFRDRNLSNRYKNEFAEVIALKSDERFNGDLTQDLMKEAELFKKANIVMYKSVNLNLSTYYNYDIVRRAIHSPYVQGQATLRMPVEADTLWELRFLNSESNFEYIFDGFNFAFIRTLDVTKSDDIYLATGYITKDTDIKIYVSNWDIQFMDTFIKYAIVVGIGLLFIIAMILVYSSTQDIGLVVRLLIAMIGILPTLYFILSWWL